MQVQELASYLFVALFSFTTCIIYLFFFDKDKNSTYLYKA